MPGGRPRIEIDQKQLESLCGLQCTMVEFCSFFSCSEETIDRWCRRTYSMSFAGVFAQKRGAGLLSLRRAQFQLAQKNAAMAIFLGKNLLGQTDKETITLNGTATGLDLSRLTDDELRSIAQQGSDENESTALRP